MLKINLIAVITRYNNKLIVLKLFVFHFVYILFIFANNFVFISVSLHVIPPSHLVSGPCLFPSLTLAFHHLRSSSCY